MNLNDWKIFRRVDRSITKYVRLAYVVHIPTGPEYPVGILVTRNNDVYTIRDRAGALLLGVELEKIKTNEPVRIDLLCGKKIIDIKNTWKAVVALSDEGRVYQWGTAEVVKQIRGCSLQSYKVAAGYCHCLALTSDGQVYAWGCNNYCGQLGVGNTKPVSEAVKVLFPDECYKPHIKSIACGNYVSYAVDQYGRVWSWGTSRQSSLGYHSSRDQLSPKLVPDFGRAEKIVSTFRAAVAITDHKEAYWWGELCEGDVRVLPTKVSFPEDLLVVNVEATAILDFSVFETNKGFYLFGKYKTKYLSVPLLSEFTSFDQAFLSAEVPTMVRPIEPKRP